MALLTNLSDEINGPLTRVFRESIVVFINILARALRAVLRKRSSQSPSLNNSLESNHTGPRGIESPYEGFTYLEPNANAGFPEYSPHWDCEVDLGFGPHDDDDDDEDENDF